VLSDSPSNPKKAYTTPILKVFGDLARLTAVVGSSGKSDGGIGTMKRTR
jgi:hypothetical protein